MRVVFVHGWSVTNTNTYGEMPNTLSNAASKYDLDLDIQHVYLGRYVSFHDEVTVDDIARAMDHALRELPDNNSKHIVPFSCITHSTGGPVVRHWIDYFYGADGLKKLPLKHLVMLAPANHGSSLAKLGKSRVGRIKTWFNGVEPGQRILDWLCLGSDGQWDLNKKYIDYEYSKNGFFPFVLTGQGIDKKLYDFLNSYLVEEGSDGVVRVAGANMNYQYFSLVQNREEVIRKRPITYKLVQKGNAKIPNLVPICIYNCYSHSGKNMGIMRSINSSDIDAPIIKDIIQCLKVNTLKSYKDRADSLAETTKIEQSMGDKYCMLIFSVRDDKGTQLGKDDYDLFLLAGNKYSPDQLPKGFFKDRQMNDKTGRLIYYLDAKRMSEIKNKKFGIRIVARPSSGFSYYCAGEFQSNDTDIQNILSPNETTYVDIELHRFVDKNVFRFGPVSSESINFKKVKPSGNSI